MSNFWGAVQKVRFYYEELRQLILVINFKLYSLYVNYFSNLNTENINKII